MYVLPDWDVALWREISLRPDTNWFFSSTCIQPHSWPNLSVILKDYGDSVDSFQEQRLLSEYKTLPAKDWSGATPPPNIVTTELWDMVGGYSVSFLPVCIVTLISLPNCGWLGSDFLRVFRIVEFTILRRNQLPAFVKIWVTSNSCSNGVLLRQRFVRR